MDYRGHRYTAADDCGDGGWSLLCRTGGAAAFLLMFYSLATLAQFAVLGGPPTDAAAAFRLLRESRILGLLRLDLPTALALPLYYLLFLGLYAALRRSDAAYTLLSTLLAFVGVTLVLATPAALSMLSLSARYDAATQETERGQLLAAGEAVMASDMWHGTGALLGGLLLQSGALLISVVMLRCEVFARSVAYVGIVTHGLDLAHCVVGPFLPSVGFVFMAIAGPLYLVWFPLTGYGLLRAGRPGGQSAAPL